MKRMHLWSLGMVVGTALLALPFCLPAQDEPPAEGESRPAVEESVEYVLPEALYDPAFDKYVDISLLELAWKTKDASLMTDIALQLREGEKVLMRPHKAGSAEDLLRLSTSIASRNGDKDLLKRIGEVAKAKEFEEVVALASNANKLAGASRKEEPELSLPVDRTSPVDFAVYGSIVNEIRNAEILGDKETLDRLEKNLNQFTNLTDKQREYLKRIMGEARSAKPDSATEDNSVVNTINKIRGETRGDDAAEIVGTILNGVGTIVHGHHGGHHGVHHGGYHGGYHGGGYHGGGYHGGHHGGYHGGGYHGGGYHGGYHGGHGGHW